MDHYQRLGVRRDASLDEIRSAYRRQLRAAHPDHDPGRAQDPARQREAARAIRALREAWAELREPASRERYDHSLLARVTAAPPLVDPRRAPRRPEAPPVVAAASPAAAAAGARTGAEGSAAGRSAGCWGGALGVLGLIVAIGVVLAVRAGGSGQGAGSAAPWVAVLDHPLSNVMTGTLTAATPTHLAGLGQVTGPTAVRWELDVTVAGGRPSGSLALRQDDGTPLCSGPVTAVAGGRVSGRCAAAGGGAQPLVSITIPPGSASGDVVTGTLAIDPTAPLTGS